MRGIRSFAAGLTRLAIVGLAAVLFVVPWGGSPAALADSSSMEFDLELICSGEPSDDCLLDDPNQVDENDHPSVQTTLTVDPLEAGGEPFVDLTNTVFRGLTPAYGKVIADGAWTGTMEFSIESNLAVPLTSNVNGLTGQPPVCAKDVAPLTSETFDLFDADLGTGTDVDPHGLGEGIVSELETQDDNLLADGSPGQNYLADGIDLLPDALANYLIPCLGLGFPIARSFGVATVSDALGVKMDVNLLLYHLGEGEYLSLTVLGYPGVPREQPSATNLTSQTVITCPPFSSSVRLFGVTQDNLATAAPEEAVAQYTATEGTYEFEILVSTGDNYDGDEAATPYDSCPAAASVDTDLMSGGNQDPDSDRWDSACDPWPGSGDNNNDGCLNPTLDCQWNLPVVGTWPMAPGNCNTAYVPPLAGGWDCDQDVDGDGTLNTVDNCPEAPDADIDNADEDENALTGVDWQLDSDADTVGDVCDPAPLVKGDGEGYATDAHPHEPAAGGYGDHDRICSDGFTVPGTEPSGDGACVEMVDSGNDGEPDFLDENSSLSYDIGEPIDVDSDADDDGHTDACEAVSGSDPLDAASTPAGSPPAGDCDNDGALDVEEAAAGSDPFAVSACTPPLTQIVAGDTDCDGAPDAAEDGSIPATCGTRDKYDPWDFYDVPVPTIHSGGDMNNRDSAVALFYDVLGVLEYSGTIDDGPPNGGGRDYDDDFDGDGIDDGIAYDREVGAPWPELGPDKSHTTAPGGAVTLFVDVLLVLDQSGHIC